MHEQTWPPDWTDQELAGLVARSPEHVSVPAEMNRRLIAALVEFNLAADGWRKRLERLTWALIFLSVVLVFLTVDLIFHA